MLDLQSLSQITAGDEALMNDLIKTFVQTTREDIRSLELAIKQQKIKEISGVAHRIKGGAAIVGASQLHELAASIEQSPRQCLPEKDHQLKEIQELFQHIEQLYPGF